MMTELIDVCVRGQQFSFHTAARRCEEPRETVGQRKVSRRFEYAIVDAKAGLLV